MKQTDVNSAFEILLEEVEGVVNSLNDDGAYASQKGQYDVLCLDCYHII